MPSTIGELFGRDADPRSYLAHDRLACQALLGVEIELEGVSFATVTDRAPEEVRRWWGFSEDGSLRGANFEAILRTPLAGDDYCTAVSVLCSYLNDKYGKKLNASERTSLHIHCDVRDLTTDQLIKLILIYMIFERALFHYVGKGRDKSNFCIPNCKFVDLFDSLGSLTAAPEKFHSSVNRMDKYGALNLSALPKFGSLEFRHHPGCFNEEDIIRWSNIILSLRKWAVESPTDAISLPEYLSAYGPPALAANVFNDLFPFLDYPDLTSDCYYGVRRVQDIVFAEQMQADSRRFLESISDKKAKKKNIEVEEPGLEEMIGELRDHPAYVRLQDPEVQF